MENNYCRCVPCVVCAHLTDFSIHRAHYICLIASLASLYPGSWPISTIDYVFSTIEHIDYTIDSIDCTIDVIDCTIDAIDYAFS